MQYSIDKCKDIDAFIQGCRQEEYEYCKTHLQYFVDKYVYFEDKDSPDIVVPFRAWEEQKKALQEIDQNRLTIFLKARQIGITWIALIYSVYDLVFYVGHSVIAISKTEDDAKELVRRVGIIASKLGAILKGGKLEFKQSSESIEFIRSDGLKSVFKAFPASQSAGRSFTANILLMDEMAFMQYAREIWTSAYPAINRPTGGKAIIISTIKRGTLYEEIWTQENNFKKIFISAFADPRRDSKWYEQAKKDLGQLVKQEYPRTAEEAFANIGGVFFDEFDPTIHVVKPFEIPSDWKIYASMDYGLDKLAYYKYAIDSKRNIYVFDEIYESGLVVSEAAKKILAENEREGESGSEKWTVPDAVCAPPDLFARELTSGKSQAIVFAENGVPLTKVSNDRETGWLCIKEALRGALNENSDSGRLFIFETCRNLIRCIQQIMIDEKRPNDCARDPHELTHSLDSLRYMLIWWWRPSEEKAEEYERVEWSSDKWEDYDNADSEQKKYLISIWGNPF